MLSDVLRHFDALVALDADAAKAADPDGVFAYIRSQLTGFRFTRGDHGDGAFSLLATRGRPRRLMSVHLDASDDPPYPGGDPSRVRSADGRAVASGAGHAKGAAAALLASAVVTRGDAALLFSTDGTAGRTSCIDAFLADAHGFDHAIAAAPTRCEAVLAHRGISAVQLRFRAAAEPSASDSDSAALRQALRWGECAIDLVESEAHRRFGGLTGLGFRVDNIESASRAGAAAPGAEVRFEFQPLSSHDVDGLHARFGACASPGALERYAEVFRGPPLPAGDPATAETARLAARDLADELGLPIGNAVDFWTEASLFSRAGLTAFAFGPGAIDLDPGRNEPRWLADLHAAAAHYRRLLA